MCIRDRPFPSIKAFRPLEVMESVTMAVPGCSCSKIAEIKAMMRPQRARDGGSRVEMQIAKWTAEGAVKGEETLPRCGSLQAMMTI